MGLQRVRHNSATEHSTTKGSQSLFVGASQVALVVKNPLANAGDIRDLSSISGLGRFPGGGQGNPLQYSCLENPMDRGAWRATVHRISKSQTQLKQLSMHAGWGNKPSHTL